MLILYLLWKFQSKMKSKNDGRTLASGNINSNVIIWQIEKDFVYTLGHKDYINFITYSPDGKYLVTGDDESKIKLWDSISGSLIHTLPAHNGPVCSAKFSPTGKSLSSCGRDGLIKVWNTETWDCTHTINGHDGKCVFSLSYSPDGNFLCSCGKDTTIKIWDTKTTRLSRTFVDGWHFTYSASFSHDGNLVASCGSEGLCIRILKTGKKIFETTDSSAVFPCAFSPDDKYLAANVFKGTVSVWEIQTGTKVHSLPKLKSAYNPIAFSPCGKYLAYGYSYIGVIIWDLERRNCSKLFNFNVNVVSIEYSPDGRLLSTGNENGDIYIWVLKENNPSNFKYKISKP